MSTVFAFPGLNSFLKPDNRTRFLHLPRVQARCAEAAGYLAAHAGLAVDLVALAHQDTAALYSKEQVSLVAVATIAVQLGVWDELLALGERPDWVLGCSLGDLTKAIVCGVCSFEAVANIPLITLRNNADINQLGAIRSITATRSARFSEDDIAWLQGEGLDVSPMSNRIVTVSGRFEHFRSLAAKAVSARWRVTPIVDFPIHSRYLSHYDATIQELVAGLHFDPPSTAPSTAPRAYSSLKRAPVAHAAGFRDEFHQLMTSPVYWREAITQLVHDHGVTRLVNIGPCDALGFISSDIDLPLETVEAASLLPRARCASPERTIARDVRAPRGSHGEML